MIYPKLFIPGPTQVTVDTLQAMTKPQVGHRTAEFSELFAEVTIGLQKFLGSQKVFLFSNPATGVWEASVRNTVKKGALNLVNGAFSGKWHTVTRACGLPCDVLEVDWGKAVKPAQVDKALSSNKYDVVTLVHSETSTGVMNPLEETAAMMKEKYPDVFLHVDAVSSMAGVELNVDELGLDTCFASVQKAFGLPAGFTVCAISERTVERSKEMDGKGYYLDFAVMDKFYQKMQTPSTPSIPHLHGLGKILDDIAEETPQGRYERHARMADHTRKWAHDRGQKLFPERGYAAITLTAIENVQGWDINHIYSEFEKRDYRLDRGYGDLKGKTFRIAHMGSVTPYDLNQFLTVFDEILTTMGIEF